jgi:hypothetical protein
VLAAEQESGFSLDQANVLLRYLPTFSEQGFVPGVWHAREGESPWFAYRGEVESFIRDLYGQRFLLTFEWPEWSADAREYLRCPQRARSADLSALRKLLTALVRGDRFVDGLLAQAFESGLVVAVLERLSELAGATHS